LCDRFMARRVWTVYQETVVEDWRVIREESDGHYSYALCNAPADTSLEKLAGWKCQRYFIERSNQDAKSELGWDELQARLFDLRATSPYFFPHISCLLSRTEGRLAPREGRRTEVLGYPAF
jgi:hypothetical protein